MEVKSELNDSVTIFSLGGLGEIGKNMYVVRYDDEIVVIDCGRKFADEEHPGVESILPDIRYLLENKELVKGIFITHGHEDHIGALPYVLPRLNVPVFGAPLSIGLARSALQEHGLLRNVKLKEVHDHSTIRFNKISISFFRTNHSIPDSLGVVVHTPEGAVVHTGDFKFDMTPPSGPGVDFGAIAQVSKGKVLALLSDSTNSERVGATPSDSTVGESIHRLFQKAKGRIFFSTFASNVYRLQQVVDAAHITDRKVAVLGFSMDKAFRISEELGHLTIPKGMLIDAKDLRKYRPEQLVILCTGSQGEPRAALARISTASHPSVELLPGDTVILSSAPIPGNTRKVYRTIDRLFRAGAEVVYGPEVDIHTSGHGSQTDQQLMLQLIQPRYFIPIHGEHRMQVAHAQLAEDMGIPPRNIFVLENGETVQLTRKRGRRGEKIPLDLTVVDGSGVENNFGIVLKDRRRLAESGLVLVLLTVDRKKPILRGGPEIITRGFVYVRESEKLIDDMRTIVLETLDSCLERNITSQNRWKAEISQRLDRYLSRKLQRQPLILPIVTHA